MVRAFVLGVILLATVGICTVRETNKQIQARYELEQLTRREDEAEKRLARLLTDEQTLRSPARLTKLARDKHLNLYALSRSLPAAAKTTARAGKTRRPGEVIEEAELETTMELASAGAR